MCRLLTLRRPLAAAWVLLLAASWAWGQTTDQRKAELAGLRVLEGRHLSLWTDLPASEDVDSLPEVFDAAVPQWAEYFGVDAADLSSWHINGYLIGDRIRFRAAGLLPGEKPGFVNGYANGSSLWMMEQPSGYYRRHLLLHEGTHAFAISRFQEAGPDWYREGVAELFGTHAWDGETLAMRVVPASREASPYWGRIRHLREAIEAGSVPSIETVLRAKTSTRDAARSYSWCWALALLLDNHPDHPGLLRHLAADAAEAGFNRRFRERVTPEWKNLQADWAALIADIDYGYSPAAMALLHRSVVPFTEAVANDDSAAAVEVLADRGWQSSGWRLRAGQSYRVVAKGRYRVDDGTDAWPCEPGGITIDYYRGRPLGRLLAAVVPEGRPTAAHFAEPLEIGAAAEFKSPRAGVLFLKANVPPGGLSRSGGVIKVRAEQR